jgi:MFS family permease
MNMEANLRKLTGLSRTIDLNYPSNRFAVYCALVALVVRLVSSHSIIVALCAGGLAFTAWALARELDPDNSGSANSASAITALLGGLLIPEARVFEAFLSVGFLMIGARAVVGTTGLKPTDSDVWGMIGVAVLCAILGWVSWGIVFYVALTFLNAKYRFKLEPVLLSVIGLVLVLIFIAPPLLWFGLGLLLGLANVFYAFWEPLRSHADNDAPLELSRMVMAQVLVWSAALILICLRHEIITVPVMTVGISILLWQLFHRLPVVSNPKPVR